MELMLVLRVLRRYWWLALIPVVIVAALTLPRFLDRAPTTTGGYSTLITYSASQQLEAIPDREGDFQDVWLASELAVNALTDWVQSNSFARAVAAVLREEGVEIEPGALRIAADNERSVGQIFLSWPDAAELEHIAEAAIVVLRSRNAEVFPQLGGVPADVTVLNEPVVVPAPAPLGDRFGPFIRLGLAVLAGLALAFLAYYLDPTLRRRDDVEALGIPVITTIPRR